MEPIKIESQLNFQNYYKINLHILWTRMRWILGIVIIFIVYVFVTTDHLVKDDYIWIGVFFGSLVFIMPLINYFAVRRMYKKVKSMSEVKVYEIDDDHIKLTGQTVSATMAWSVIDRIKERENDFLAFVSNGKGVHFLPKAGFDKNEDIMGFKNLVKNKQVKNNFKEVKSFSPLPLSTP